MHFGFFQLINITSTNGVIVRGLVMRISNLGIARMRLMVLREMSYGPLIIPVPTKLVKMIIHSIPTFDTYSIWM